jgi:hypothetical protein
MILLAGKEGAGGAARATGRVPSAPGSTLTP